MLTQHFNTHQRRALNQIWSAAGRYDFIPLFLATDSSGEPDLYMNCVVGCVQRRYGPEVLNALFAVWAGDRRQAVLDDLCWLALESAVFCREMSERPVLEELRLAHAERFFTQEHQLSRQEWMANNSLVYTLQAARWRAVLGRRPPVMTLREKQLSVALDCGWLEPEALPAALLEAFARARLFHGRTRNSPALRFHLTGRRAELMARLMPSEIVHTDVVTVGHSTGGPGDGKGPKLDTHRAKLRLNENAETDREYIESCFGPSLFPPRELALLEQQLCTGTHFGCRLWFTAGNPDPEHAKRRETRHLARQSALQYARNRDAFAENRTLYQNAILRLTEQIRGCLQIHSQTEAETARCGRLNSTQVWRAATLQDPRIFTRDSVSAQPGFAVDLLLDASSSRLHCQEEVSAQGYILSESLRQCGIPVRVSAFCSLRGYTVLRVLKDFGERSSCVFRYFASGWNRDGLVLRAAETFLRTAPGEQKLLILLTDASPNDSHRIPSGGKYPLGHDYTDAPAAEDTAAEVRALRRHGIRVSAVFMGQTAQVPTARLIYGQGLARIQSMDRLAVAAGRLIQEEIRALSS